MCNKPRTTSQTSSSSKYSNDDDLYAIWLKNLESTDQDRKFKVRSKQPMDASLDLISGNLLLDYSDSAPSTPSSTPATTPDNTPQKQKPKIPEVKTPDFESPSPANIAILDSPSMKKSALLKKNLGKLFQKFQKNRLDDESFGPTYHKYQYNCSLYEHFDKLNVTHNSQFCIEAN